jgi:KDO2-lipid IV(A) lauroyltransferase
MFAALVARMTERIVPLLPGAADRPLAEALGTIAYVLAPRARRAVRANLAIIAPERRDREALVRRTFVAQARNYLEIFRIPRLDIPRFAASVRLEGWERFECAHAKGRGVIIASAHYGPVAFVGQIVIARGYEFTLPVESTESELGRALNRARGGKGLRVVPVDSARGLYRVLRRGGVLGLLADRAITGTGERVPFFGREALLPSAEVVLALRTGAALVPGFTWRDGERLTATIEPPIELVPSGDRRADVREGVRRYAEILERYIRRAPEQWTVFEPVWER